MSQQKKTLTIINGSPRSNGNTDIIINELLSNIDNDKFTVEVFKLRNMDINDCIGCYACMKNGHCIQHDDMREIYSSIENSDVVIFASPIYWWSVPGTMKKLIDRLFAYYSKENRERLKGKKVITISSLNQVDEQETNIIRQTYHMLFNSYEITLLDEHYFYGVMEKGKIMEYPTYIETVREIGRSISEM
ncbi:flavodoxin family protein [Clostridium sp. OS1-26]|uniref:flavodoxin family protein n=1 Tax=Clostridium sp. OS1-26 TaxID=3070681 RepID=UPI0027E0AF0E|nr:flavodoxin family protein [Clostridium sp. OS1-26]WML34934.1 flavodoxin family protein [Clostridium sp. OS1-26]